MALKMLNLKHVPGQEHIRTDSWHLVQHEDDKKKRSYEDDESDDPLPEDDRLTEGFSLLKDFD